jgi:hypothetical protein
VCKNDYKYMLGIYVYVLQLDFTYVEGFAWALTMKLPRKATQTVVSSITCSSFIQRSFDSEISLSTAKRGSVVATAMSITSSLLMNSHKPSEAITSTKSS